MHGRFAPIGMAAVIVASALPARAQEKTVGIVMGYPASLGVLWRVSDGIALRPEVNVNRTSVETTSVTSTIGGVQTATTTTEGWTASAGLSALFYLGTKADVRIYVAPRFAHAWSRRKRRRAFPSARRRPSTPASGCDPALA